MEADRTSGTVILPAGSPVPGRDDVLGQAIPFDRARWVSLLPDSGWWPGELDACPIVAGRARVDRSTVFDISRRADTVEGRRHLLTASLVWGSGTKARSVARHTRIFTSSSASDIDAHLAAVLRVLRREGAVRAYFAFNNDERIKFLGPAFFTKVLYFAGHDHPVGPWRPLILDSVVARSLRAADAEVKWSRGGWTTPRYGRYLSLAHDYAGVAGVLPDQVEAALFSHGRHLP
ncbi:8-oxoguanine DNA glycosylase OGG fold protein [Streptomyces sp. NPDC002309]